MRGGRSPSKLLAKRNSSAPVITNPVSAPRAGATGCSPSAWALWQATASSTAAGARAIRETPHPSGEAGGGGGAGERRSPREHRRGSRSASPFRDVGHPLEGGEPAAPERERRRVTGK